MNTSSSNASVRRDTAFLGHPAGLGWLSFSEFWERFSYYGMQALLVLYMTHTLLHPGHVEHVLGFGPFRGLIESAYGKLSPQALASAIFGLYAGLVYLTPIAGGFLADRFIGRTWAVTSGASLMAVGHFLMAFEASFLLALLCLLIGVGCFKGNIATQVGELYGADDPRRADGFQIYFLGIQLAVIGSPIVCSTLAAVYGWSWGFGAAGVGMVIGLCIYLLGRATLPREDSVRPDHVPGARPALGRDGWRKIFVLVLLLPVLAVGGLGNQQIFNAYLVWGEANYQLVILGWRMPIEYILSFGSIISTATLILSVTFWRWYAKRWAEPDEITKITLGVAIASVAPLVLAAAAAIVAASGQKVSLGWAVAFEIINDIGFANVFPVGLALYSRAAPKGLEGSIVALYLVNLFMGNMLVGWVGGLLEKMSGSDFWLLHAGLIFAAAAVFFVIKRAFGHLLAPAYEEPHLPAIEAAA
jgi:POT family proton-dependent oligopeptide transporter